MKQFLNSNYYDIVLNTDSNELIDLMKNNHMRELDIIDRKTELGKDDIAKIDVINDCLEQMERKKSIKYDIVVDLDITSPLRTVNDLNNVINKHINSNADVTTTVVPARRNPYFNQLKNAENGYKKVIDSNYTARQQAPDIYDMNASIYAYSPEYLKKEKGVLDGYVECVKMYDTGILDLDHEGDLILMEIIAKYLFETQKEFTEIYENIKS